MFGTAIAVVRLHGRLDTNFKNLPRIFKQCYSQQKFLQSKINVCSYSRVKSPMQPGFLRSSICGQNVQIRRILSTAPKDTVFLKSNTNPIKYNTKVANNVMLFRYERPLAFKLALIFGIIALVGCLTMADNVYLILCKDLFNSSVDLTTRIYAHILPLTAIFIGIIAGPVILGCIWYITVRTVKYAVLHKGGQEVTLITYHPIKGEAKLTVPVSQISSQASRDMRKLYASVKVRHKKFNYLFDKNGHFVNPELFDSAVGLKRF